MFVFALRIVFGLLAIEQLRRRSLVALSPRLIARFEALQARLGIDRVIRYCQCEGVSVPAVIGVFRPIVLLPLRALTGLSAEQLDAVIAHELGHILRFDVAVNFLQVIAETLLFFHPAVWWLNQRIRADREDCCDDVAVAACGSRVTYARALAAMEGWRETPSFAMAATGGTVAARVARLLGMNRGERGERATRAIAAMLVLTTALATGRGIAGCCAARGRAIERSGCDESPRARSRRPCAMRSRLFLRCPRSKRCRPLLPCLRSKRCRPFPPVPELARCCHLFLQCPKCRLRNLRLCRLHLLCPQFARPNRRSKREPLREPRLRRNRKLRPNAKAESSPKEPKVAKEPKAPKEPKASRAPRIDREERVETHVDVQVEMRDEVNVEVSVSEETEARDEDARETQEEASGNHRQSSNQNRNQNHNQNHNFDARKAGVRDADIAHEARANCPAPPRPTSPRCRRWRFQRSTCVRCARAISGRALAKSSR